MWTASLRFFSSRRHERNPRKCIVKKIRLPMVIAMLPVITPNADQLKLAIMNITNPILLLFPNK